ncbi:hypothetical protein PoB_001095900 [Plakobranchus ocellatus]|uniref:Uncharacterized protein n=1 Tax=Plakobranchus ocellatus TaxID=259542 RepID=A0AAV3YQU3_9GAST|nr:hypothetical protein PoB_001095900 [Plakobranchus ocellatus]
MLVAQWLARIPLSKFAGTILRRFKFELTNDNLTGGRPNTTKYYPEEILTDLDHLEVIGHEARIAKIQNDLFRSPGSNPFSLMLIIPLTCELEEKKKSREKNNSHE